MQIKIQEIRNKRLWETFNLRHEFASYFQSWSWGKIQKRAGVGVMRFGVFRQSKLLGIFQVFDTVARRGHFLHLRGGPILLNWGKDVLEEVINFLKDKKGASFIRISPLINTDDDALKVLASLGFKNSPISNTDAENRWVLDLHEPKEEILKKMRKTTRYMIKKGDSMNINIIRSQKRPDIKEFTDIYLQTSIMKHFVPHSLITEEFEEFIESNKAFLYLATRKKKILAGAVITYYGNEAIYRYGATALEGRRTPASYLLQWSAICDAKRKGLKIYNFWGIAKDDNASDPWYGPSQFKKGFGGRRVDFAHSMDLPINKRYWISYAADYVTKMRRHFRI